MRKRILIIAVITILVLISCACGRADDIIEEEIPLSKTVATEDGGITLNVPENWEADDSRNNDTLVLTLTDNVSAYAQVYCYALDEDFDSIEAFLLEYVDYYGDDILSEVETLEVGGMPARRFEYLYEDYNENFYEARFRGFVYLIETPDGVISIDAYYSIIEPFSETDEVSTELERALLVRIIESIRIIETPDDVDIIDNENTDDDSMTAPEDDGDTPVE